MLSEGRRRAERGSRVVVACVETYGRPRTLGDAPRPRDRRRAPIEYRGADFDEMDTDAVIQRQPEIALVDELAHTNVPGARRGKRWEDVIDLLAARDRGHHHGQHPAPREPERRRRRGDRGPAARDGSRLGGGARRSGRAGGHVAARAAAADAARQRLPRPREGGARAAAVLHDRQPHRAPRAGADAGGEPGRRDAAVPMVEGPCPETRERVLVCVSEPGASAAGSRATRRADRPAGARRLPRGLHVRERDEPATTAWFVELEQLVADVGGEFHVIDDDDAVAGVLKFAYAQYVTQLVVGESLRSRMQEILRGSFVNELIRKAANDRHPRHRATRALISRGRGDARSAGPRRPPATSTRSRATTATSPRRWSRRGSRRTRGTLARQGERLFDRPLGSSHRPARS